MDDHFYEFMTQYAVLTQVCFQSLENNQLFNDAVTCISKVCLFCVIYEILIGFLCKNINKKKKKKISKMVYLMLMTGTNLLIY